MTKKISFQSKKSIIAVLAVSLVSIGIIGCGDESYTGTDSNPGFEYRDPEVQSEPQPEPQPAPTIDPFYGTGPGGDFYGN